MALVIAGQIAAMDRNHPDATFKGRVWIGDDGTIDAVTKGTAKGPAGFADAAALDVGDAWVLPGLIDLHNHLGYNTLPLWAEPSQKVAFLHHDSWPRAASYQADVSDPAEALKDAAPEALLAYVQLRALVGGTTAIQGWPSANRAFLQVLRNVDSETAGTGNRDLIFTAVITETTATIGKRAQEIGDGAGFIYHCAEGQAGSVVAKEFTQAASAGCLKRTFIGIHCNAVLPADWPKWKPVDAGAVVWSPFSNLWLYGGTLDLPAALAQKVTICLGSDWGPSGTKHVLAEVKVAKLVSKKLGFGLTDRDLVAMLTTNPGDALARCWNKTAGRLVPGAFGDVTVVAARGSGSVWSDVVAATESDVRLAVYNGVPRYGDASALTQANLTPSSPLTVGKSKRRFAIPRPNDPTKAWSWADIKAALDAVRKSPGKALHKAQAQRARYAGPPNAPKAPLVLVLDMPGGGAPRGAGGASTARKVVIPPLPSLVHDKAFFDSIHGRGFHGGLLDGLAKFY